MADNYLEFSETIDDVTPEEATWIDQQLSEDPNAGCPVFLTDYEDRDPDDTDCGFTYSFEEDDGKRRFWVRSDGCGNVNHVVHLIQKCLKRFRPDQCWSLTYANTCSKPRRGEFGGGAVFVTAHEIRWNDGYDFVEEQRKTFQRRQEHDNRLIRTAEERGITPEQLDESVHEAAASAASSINNGGVADQITYLVEQFGAAETERILDELSGPGNDTDEQDGDPGQG
jgi:hypothetical protein